MSEFLEDILLVIVTLLGIAMLGVIGAFTYTIAFIAAILYTPWPWIALVVWMLTGVFL